MVFFGLRPDENNPGGLTMFVASAYGLDQWGKETVPKGSRVRFDHIGQLRLNGQTFLLVEKQKGR